MEVEAEFLDADGAARLCGWSRKTLLSRRSLGLPTPPAIVVARACRLRWRRVVVIEWLTQYEEAPRRKRGRPRKS